AVLLAAVGGGYTLYSRGIFNFAGIIGRGGGSGDGKTKPGAVNLAYAVQIEENGFRSVKEGHAFRGGDRLRLVTKTSFPSFLYCFHEDIATGDMDVVFVGREPVAAGQEITIPERGAITMDTQPGPERFTLIASAKPIQDLEFNAAKVSKSEFQSITGRVFADPKIEWKTKPDADWNVVEGGPKDSPLLRTSFTLKHD
ncbi:MAG: DUF4384 domain-containing protein, partial [Bryobacteraceae bacterium]